MPTAVTKDLESSEESDDGSDDGSEPLDVEVDDSEGVESGGATETDDSNDESGSDMESEDEVAESDGAELDDEEAEDEEVDDEEVEDEEVEMNGTAAKTPQSSAAKGKTWNTMFEEAKQFVASHGTMLVPFNHRLFPWMKEQAALYRRVQAGEKKLLTKEQKDRLKILGMDDFLESPVHRLRCAWIIKEMSLDFRLRLYFVVLCFDALSNTVSLVFNPPY